MCFSKAGCYISLEVSCVILKDGKEKCGTLEKGKDVILGALVH